MVLAYSVIRMEGNRQKMNDVSPIIKNEVFTSLWNLNLVKIKYSVSFSVAILWFQRKSPSWESSQRGRSQRQTSKPKGGESSDLWIKSTWNQIFSIVLLLWLPQVCICKSNCSDWTFTCTVSSQRPPCQTSNDLNLGKQAKYVSWRLICPISHNIYLLCFVCWRETLYS